MRIYPFTERMKLFMGAGAGRAGAEDSRRGSRKTVTARKVMCARILYYCMITYISFISFLFKHLIFLY